MLKAKLNAFAGMCILIVVDAQLKPFGSTKSGLAMDNCDLDVCFLARSVSGYGV